MHIKTAIAISLLGTLSACMSTSDPLGPSSNAWSDYKSWHKSNPEVNTGDPTGFLGGVHRDTSGYRDVFVNSVGEATNRGERAFPYPAGTVIVKESYRNVGAWQAQRNPQITIMVKLAQGMSPQTSDWEYINGAGGGSRGTGTSDLAVFCHTCHALANQTDYAFSHASLYDNQ